MGLQKVYGMQIAHCKTDKELEKHCQATLFISDAPLAGAGVLEVGTQGGPRAGPPPAASAPPRPAAPPGEHR